jgi:hypothetical protein
MAVLKSGGWTEDLNYLVKKKSECFFCGDKIPKEQTCIYWMGWDGTGIILLHKDCAVLLAGHLVSDFTRLNIGAAEDIAIRNGTARVF